VDQEKGEGVKGVCETFPLGGVGEKKKKKGGGQKHGRIKSKMLSFFVRSRRSGGEG